MYATLGTLYILLFKGSLKAEKLCTHDIQIKIACTA